MTVRELLELAAKAAGYWEINGWSIETHKGMRWIDQDCYFERYWNPLTDDGDALRLAVKLEMCVSLEGHGRATAITVAGLEVEETNRDDPYAATRRAIVRAAAEIGRGM
jgi:hypothetical protein